MIVNTNTVEVVTNQATTEFELDNSNGQLFAVLSELYSKPVESTIREICTNCTDAHILSNNQARPFIVKLPNYEKNIMNISFRDFGPGLNHSEIMSIYRVYGKSTKTKSNNVTGCLGLGSKSPYSICSTFYVRSYKDGKMSLYVCTMGNNGKPNITEEPVIVDTFEENGLEVVIPFYKEVNFLNILKDVLKHFKVKPLVYTQQSELEQDTLINIDWLPSTPCEKLTNTIYIPTTVKQMENFCSNLDYSRNLIPAEVIQLQIYYPLDKTTIMQTIERYNKLYTNEYNETVKGYKIDDEVVRTIGHLFTIGFQFYADPGMIAFSPSREYIKYTDITLIYIIRELIKAAKLLIKKVNSQYGLINTKEEVFDKLIGRNNKYNLLNKYFDLNNPNVMALVHHFDKDTPIDRLVGYTHRLSTNGDNKVKRYPANFIHSFNHFTRGYINIKHSKELVEAIISNKVKAMDVFDTTGTLVGGNDNVLLFNTYTNALRDFVSDHLSEYIKFNIENIHTGLKEAFKELCYYETEAVLINSGGVIDNDHFTRWMGFDIKAHFKHNAVVGIDRHQLYDTLINAMENKVFFEIFNQLNISSVRGSVRVYKDSSRNPYSSKYVTKMYKALLDVLAFHETMNTLITKFMNLNKKLSFKLSDVNFMVKLDDVDIKRFMQGYSRYFIKFAHMYDVNPSRMMKRIKQCTPISREYNINTWQTLNLMDDEKIKEINDVYLSGSILKVKILKYEVTNNLPLYEAMMIELLTQKFDIFKNQNMLGKADKTAIYAAELRSLEIPEKYCTLKPYETMVLVKVGARGKKIQKERLNINSLVKSGFYKWEDIPSIESIVDLNLAARDILKDIEKTYKQKFKEEYINLQRVLRSTKDPEEFPSVLSMFYKTYKNGGVDLENVFERSLYRVIISPEYISETTYGKVQKLTWESIKLMFSTHEYSLAQTWENYNELILICTFLYRLRSELCKRYTRPMNDLMYQDTSFRLVQDHYVVYEDGEVRFRGGVREVIYSLRCSNNVTYYSKPNGIRTIIMRDTCKFTIDEATNSKLIDELVEKYKIVLALKGTNQKVNLGLRKTFKSENFIKYEKSLTETILRGTKKFIKDILYNEKLTDYLWLFQDKNEYMYLYDLDHLFNTKQIKETYNVLKICLETLNDQTFNTLYTLPQNLEYVYSEKVWNYFNEVPAISAANTKSILVSKGYEETWLKDFSSSAWQMTLPLLKREDAIDWFKKTKPYLKLNSKLKKEYLEFAGAIFDNAINDLTPIARLCGYTFENYDTPEEFFKRIEHSYNSTVTATIKQFIEFRREMRRDLMDLELYKTLPAVPSRDDSKQNKIKKEFSNVLTFIDDYNSLKSNYKSIPNCVDELLKVVENFKNDYQDVAVSQTNKRRYSSFEALVETAAKTQIKKTVNAKINLREQIKTKRGLNAKTNLQLRKHRVF